ncbi:Dihydrofolate reductase [Pseudolycoriella hygida]|uniref:dihydrofolate reductase n=1 Tax=Pseudolycoriella hygida TaxID=35572 RepID=A0A9Q0N1S9_9DIPT|nr:Dihydrofolate reductase [Pseudolycoriella hygida]
MSQKKFSLIAAACENMGIGINGSLPWRLKNELKYFNQRTTKIDDISKKNALIMGRKTYFGIPENKRPLPGRLNIVLSATSKQSDYPAGVLLCRSFDEAIAKLADPSLSEEIENVWIVGGYSVYKEAMASPLCHRIYFTEIKASFECDAFFPNIPDDFKLVENDDDLPSEVQEENGLKYQYKIYEKL